MDSQVIFALCLTVLFFAFVIWIIISSRRSEQNRRDNSTSEKVGKPTDLQQ